MVKRDQAETTKRILSYVERLIAPMTEAVLVIDQSARVVCVNQAALQLLDVTDRTVALRPLDEYQDLIKSWQVGEQSFVPGELSRTLKGESIPRRQATLTTAAGREHFIQFSTTPIRDEDGQVMLAMLIAQDLTEEERNRAYWQAVGTAAQGLTAELDVDRVLSSAIDMIIESFGERIVLGIWRLDEAQQRLILRISRGIGEHTAARLQSLPLDCPSFICESANTQQVQYTEDAQKLPPPGELDQRLIEDEGLVSWIGTPLLTNGRLLGVLGYGLRAPQRFYAQDLQAVRTVAGLFAIAIDHAELYQESERDRQKLELERELRTRFTAAVAHDLRGPLTIIKGNTQLLARPGPLPANRRERLLRSIGEQVDRLDRMIQDLSDVSRIATGRFIVEREHFDLALLIRRVVADVQRSSPTRRFRLEAPEQVTGTWDPIRVVQILENLLTNAVKFSPDGGEVVVRVVPRKDDVLVRITDEGVGIAREHLDKLFQPFARVGATDGTRGTGLGLYIARSIVEAHGGRIWAESPGPGKGSTFAFTLPLT